GLALIEQLLDPAISLGVGAGELVERECLADVPAQAVQDELDLVEQEGVPARVGRGRFQAAVAVLPLAASCFQRRQRHSPMLLSGRAALLRRPDRLDLRQTPLAEGVAGPREGERRMGVKAL